MRACELLVDAQEREIQRLQRRIRMRQARTERIERELEREREQVRLITLRYENKSVGHEVRERLTKGNRIEAARNE